MVSKLAVNINRKARVAIATCAFGILASGSSLTSCGDPSGGGPDLFQTFDRKAMLASIAQNVIVPAFDSLAVRAARMEVAIAQFTNSPSEATLGVARSAWIDAASAWKRAEFLRVGPLGEGHFGRVTQIDFGTSDPMRRGAQINETALNVALTNSAISKEFVASQDTTLQGLPAVEYFLYKASEAEVIAKFSTDPLATNRGAFLRAVASLLTERLAFVRDTWQPGAGNYVATFVKADGRDLGSSLNQLVNEMVFFVEKIRNEKVGRPMGKSNTGQPQPDQVEAWLSAQSFNFIEKNIAGLKAVFTADAEGRTGTGIDALLDHMDVRVNDRLLSEVIVLKMDAISAKCQAFTVPLSEAVLNRQEELDALHLELQQLIVLMKVQMVGNLGLMISYTDNDGD